MANKVNRIGKKNCQVWLPIHLNHSLKDIQKERELTVGTAPSLADLIVEILEKSLSERSSAIAQ